MPEKPSPPLFYLLLKKVDWMDACSRDLSCIGLGCSASPGKYDHCPVDKVVMGEGSRVNLEKAIG